MWGILGKIGNGIRNGIDNAAYNSLGGGLLGDALQQQQGQGLLGVQPTSQQGSGEAPEYSGTPQRAQPQRWTPDPQQTRNLRSQWLMALGTGIKNNDLGGALQGYQQNAVGQIQAGQQAAQRQAQQQRLAQFQQDAASASGDPTKMQAVAAKWSPYFGKEVQEWGAANKSLQDKEAFVPVGDLGYLNRGTGEFHAIPHDKKAGTPEQQAFDELVTKNKGNATAAFNELLSMKAKDPKEPSKDDRAISIFAKPPATRTPDENAYLAGYQKYVDVNKTQPGVMRMEVLANSRPYGYIDPGNPDSVVYGTGRQAMGQQAPSSVQFQAGKALQKDFTSGPDARTLTNINTAHEHIGQLLPLIDALHNNNLTAANQLGNAFAKATGNPAPTNFQLVKTALIGEIGKTFTGGVATVEEGNQLGKAIDAANSPAALRGVAAQAAQLMESKRHQLQNQYEAGKGGQPNFGNNAPQPQQQGGTVRYVSQGRTYNIPASQEAEFLQAHRGAVKQ